MNNGNSKHTVNPIHTFIDLKGQMKGNFSTMKPKLKKGLYEAIFFEYFREKRIEEAKAQRLKEKQEFEAMANACIQENGAFYMVHFSRDCDMVEVTRAVKFDTVEEFYEYQEDVYAGAEGPNSFDFISFEEGEEFNTVTRDRIMENFENGGNGFFL